jgi:hypothetical protein
MYASVPAIDVYCCWSFMQSKLLFWLEIASSLLLQFESFLLGAVICVELFNDDYSKV